MKFYIESRLKKTAKRNKENMEELWRLEIWGENAHQQFKMPIRRKMKKDEIRSKTTTFGIYIRPRSLTNDDEQFLCHTLNPSYICTIHFAPCMLGGEKRTVGRIKYTELFL